jgi:hypothetical protein
MRGFFLHIAAGIIHRDGKTNPVPPGVLLDYEFRFFAYHFHGSMGIIFPENQGMADHSR